MQHFTTKRISCAEIGPLNPMPDIKNISYIHAGYEVKPSLADTPMPYLGKGMISTLLPYQIQDGYTRERKEKEVLCVVLENEHLRAEFLPQYGGRLWSLYDKDAKKDLLYQNSVIQPCNFALRNAWLSGGVEFNVGIKGHTPLTCSPMFCEWIGTDAVRFYEFERIRQVSYSVTAYLPAHARALYIRPCIENTSDEEVFMYWWSNIAVSEKPNTRVIVPAMQAIHCLYEEDHYSLGKESIPLLSNGTDATYSYRADHSSDYFYCIPKEEKKWIAAVDPDGSGLLQYSDQTLIGRKLFLWGHQAGGRHWNEFLSEPGQAYIEIQAGLAQTQLEHIPMPKKTIWQWTESYTALNGADPALYGDWQTAVNTVRAQIEEKIQKGQVASFDALSDLQITGKRIPFFSGSGWGHLENLLRRACQKEPISHMHAYPAVWDAETEPFRALLEEGALPCPDPALPPASYVKGSFWKEKLQQSATTKKGDHYYTYLQLGVVCYEMGDLAGAEQAWKTSLVKTPSLWAYRNLAMLCQKEYGKSEEALSLLQKAISMPGSDTCLPLLREYGTLLTATKEKCGAWEAFYKTLSPAMQQQPRLQVLLIIDLLHSGRPKEAANLLTEDFVISDIKEGELSLSALWREIHIAILKEEMPNLSDQEASALAEQRFPLPYSLDFRMHGKTENKKKRGEK